MLLGGEKEMRDLVGTRMCWGPVRSGGWVLPSCSDQWSSLGLGSSIRPSRVTLLESLICNRVMYRQM